VTRAGCHHERPAAKGWRATAAVIVSSKYGMPAPEKMPGEDKRQQPADAAAAQHDDARVAQAHPDQSD
jgi:hypothetical protein